MNDTKPASEPLFGTIIDDVELLGIEVLFIGVDDPRDSCWLPFNSGLTALYGRNGAGKTTVLNAIETALSGVSVPGMKCRLYLRLLATDLEAEQDQVQSQIRLKKLLAEWAEEAEEGDSAVEVEFSDQTRQVVPGLPTQGPRHRPGTGWFFQKIIASVPKGCEFFNSERNMLGSYGAEIWEYPSPAFSIPQIEAGEWSDVQYPSWREIVRLLLIGNAVLDEAERASRTKEFPPISPLVYVACEEVEASRLLCFEAIGTQAKPLWEIHLAAQVAGDTAAQALLVESLTILQKDIDGLTDQNLKEHIFIKVRDMGHSPGYEDSNDNEVQQRVVLASVLGSSLLHERASREMRSSSGAIFAPYAPLGGDWSKVKISTLPVLVKKIEPSDECDLAVQKFVSVASWPIDRKGTLLLEQDAYGHDVSIADLPNLESKNQFLEKLARKFRGLGIGINGIRLELEGGLRSALAGGMLKMKVQDSVTEQWLKIDQLSSGQRSWLAFVLNNAGLTGFLENNRTILLADEVDRGLAERAVAPTMMFLESLYPICVLATHSPAALRSQVGLIQHVERISSGVITLSDPIGLDDPRKTAERLGISVSELLTFLEVVVLVEGEHDRIVIESLFKDLKSVNGLNTRVIPFRGTKNLTNIEARILFEFTDASIVLIVDHARQVRIEEALAKARESSGKRITPALIREVLGPLNENNASGEERVLANVIEQAMQRRVLDRITLVGLEVVDMTMIFPTSDFGLDKTWSEYQVEWLDAKSKKTTNEDFKKYLKSKYNAKINVGTIEAAVQKLSTPPKELWYALEAIERARFSRGIRATES